MLIKSSLQLHNFKAEHKIKICINIKTQVFCSYSQSEAEYDFWVCHNTDYCINHPPEYERLEQLPSL